MQPKQITELTVKLEPGEFTDFYMVLAYWYEYYVRHGDLSPKQRNILGKVLDQLSDSLFPEQDRLSEHHETY
ncbi:MAG: hypothetical protein L0H53_03820 [Candidatus Nitrosocosmicus sp.]|nr:hypothetical protein [Candidatus Nitrosocosmicus sp.]MDN5866246.1 hypothetical protein [Candidatus Nitrosocosmicus sp.]